MYTKTLLFIFAFAPIFAFAQEQSEETLFRNARISGAFCSPIFTYSKANGHSAYGAGGGVGLVFNRFSAGFFGMGETFSTPKFQGDRLALGYGGLWLGYVLPSHKLLHLYTSLKIAGGATGSGNFDDDWEFDEDWNDAIFVAIPEAGLELNVARWFRLSGTVGYRYVGGFDGWGSLGKNDLNALTYGLTLRFGWFGGRR
ncbi:MAG: hypothetical protein IT260_08765 [Saprospiraceae bacterium]|nr:hypothetical protein [Saprospiraceae bacterium]